MARKLAADSLNLYVRVKGQSNFRILAGKRVRFPMDDDTPSADGKPEEREYQAIAVIGDKEVGQPSDIVSVAWRPWRDEPSSPSFPPPKKLRTRT
jgi:hypothetical protein